GLNSPFDNYGLSAEGDVNVCNNYLDLTPGSSDMMDIEALQDRGVEVSY
ncbi:unnamed protein product, partial [marine sediment metagenome]